MQTDTIFFVISILLISSALIVCVSKHSVFALLSLTCCFLLSSLILFILECETLGYLLIIIYVGAIAVLFLFAVIMLDFKETNIVKNIMKYGPIGVFFIFCFLAPISNKLFAHFDYDIWLNSFYLNKYQNWYDLSNCITDIEIFGQVLYSNFLLSFLVVGFILLAVLIGVVYLVNNFNNPKILKQSTFKQLSRNSNLFFNI